MTLDHLSIALRALVDARVRFLIAGGLPVLAHGHSRVTHDVDIVLALDPEKHHGLDRGQTPSGLLTG